ncbi:protein-ADP-ribose hydrolase [Streptococcus ruminantium]|uniref:protein-ADP-ribose hydrolase n=1 Tax=Streptococcus ruminantium TaxID=1917441 RepID=UPI0012DD8E28|nr:protein-ADP-ribose hydrolase [Streptococcus ruminantium]
MPREEQQQLLLMIGLLKTEKGEEQDEQLKNISLNELMQTWRGLVNQRPAGPVSKAYMEAEAQFLTAYKQAHQVGLEECLPTREEQVFLYEGDLCHLQVDAIVNAANSRLLGCFIPNHACLDNAIHTFSGIELRQYCAKLMEQNSGPEAVGRVKVTPAFYLPADWIFHTVGPFIAPGKPVSPIRRSLLEQCYRSCLDEAKARGLHSIAFPALATGEFGYPKEQAAELAVSITRKWLKDTGYRLDVIFSAFSSEDRLCYKQLLGKREEDVHVADA